MTDKTAVIVSEHANSSGFVVGHAILNVESTLNALSLEMIRLLMPALQHWAVREDVAAVLITGAGEKAFCAGGDIQALYHSISANHEACEMVNDYPFRFFEEEYRLDYCIHTFPKPLITLGHGIVMGGGLGILGGSQFRVLTERSRLAVPEITIGLFPDAGASWTLRNMAAHHAEFLGLTGSHVNAADSLLTGMGTHVTSHDTREAWLSDLLQLPWSADVAANTQTIKDWLDQQVSPGLPASELARVPERELHYDDLSGEVAAICALEGTSDWIDRGINNLRNGCPTTAGIVLEQLRRVRDMSLADSFRMELTVATHCANNADFREGVRALLIDKDNSPRWAFGSVDALPRSHVLSHFEAPWPDHPLADLGGD
jgi:enoyl-CoA hydratase/carnithine racemase